MEYHLGAIRVHIWVIQLSISMVYWLWESYRLCRQNPRIPTWEMKIVWIIKEHGLYGVWVRRESTVYVSFLSPQVALSFELVWLYLIGLTSALAAADRIRHALASRRPLSLGPAPLLPILVS